MSGPDLRHSGVGWPNGAVPGGNGNILTLPSPDLLMLGSEHWHYDEAIRAGKRVLFRGMARQGFRPSELKWDVVRYVDEILRDAVRVSEPITDFVAWNELNLQDERGDTLSDFGDLTKLFANIGAFQVGVIAELRRRPLLKRARIHFGAWAPKDETDYVQHWRTAAEMADVIDVHAYGHGTGIIEHLNKYRALFPGKPTEVTEWHSDGGPVEMDRETLALFANEAAVHPDFRAYYFLFQWNNPPAHQRALADAIAIWGNGARYGLFLAPPVSTRVPDPEIPPMTEYEAFCRSEAARRGIFPDVAVIVANSEGGLTEPARRGTFSTGSSWWAFQLHYGGAGYDYLGTTAGMGNTFTSVTGWAPGDPAAWKDAMRFALDEARRGGWGPWYGAKARGITGFYGIDRSVPWDGTPADEWDYKKRGPSVVTYNPNTPPILQDDPWSCAPTALRWALTSLGRNPGPTYIEDLLVRDGVVSKELGLLDGSGAGLAAWIGRQGDEYYGSDGFYGNSEPSVSYNSVALEGDHQYPLLIGGQNWNHWTGVRGYDAGRNVLLLANPSPGWMGVGQEMNASQFAFLGPFSMVRVLHPDLPGVGTPPVVEPDPPIIVPPADTRMARARELLVQALAVLDEPAPA